MAVGDFIEKYEFSYLMEQALDQIPAGIDTREGSIIYDALAPACYQLAEFYMNLMNLVNDSFPTTAIGEYLDLKVMEQGLERFQATQGVKVVQFSDVDDNLMDVPIGSRYTSIGSDAYIYRVTSKISLGVFTAISETFGADPNSYMGELLPVDNINNLGTALAIDNQISGRDIEDDDSLRARYFLAINEKPFGGNIADYRRNVLNIEGVGGVQVFSTWNGGGTVGILVVDPQGMPASSTVVDRVVEVLDNNGRGLAPIGHKVTVSTPTTSTINVTADVTISPGADVQSAIEEGIETYLSTIRAEWDDLDVNYEYHTKIYTSRILVVILQTPGVNNASNIKINGQAQDIDWHHTMTTSKTPILGSVVLNEN